MLTLKRIELSGFKSFANKTILDFPHPISAIVGPNGSGKSNIIEAIKWVTGDQTLKGLRVKKGEELIFHGPNNNSFQNASVSIILKNPIFNNEKEYLKQPQNNKNPVATGEEIKISRLIQKNGINKYFFNESEMRLKDIVETFSLIKLSSSRHYIVNQGASDKILNASPTEKKMIIEGALGLDVCHIKILDFSKKIKQTEENIIKINTLRNEITPHLKFLEKQINKFKKSASLKEILKNKCAVYIIQTASFIQKTKIELNDKKTEPREKLKNINQSLKNCEENLKVNHINPEKENEHLKHLEKKLETSREKYLDYERQLGRIEGMLETEKLNYETKISENKTNIKKKTSRFGETEITFKKQLLRNFYDDISLKIKNILDLKQNPNNVTDKLWTNIETIKETIDRFFAFVSVVEARHPVEQDVALPQNQDKSKKLEEEKLNLEEKIKIIKSEETLLTQEIKEIKNKIETQNIQSSELQNEKILLYGRLDEIKEVLRKIEFEEMKINSKAEEFEKEKIDILQFLNIEENDMEVQPPMEVAPPKLSEEDLLKIREEIQKIRFKIEECGEPDKETIQEYETLTKRDELFEKELKDLRESLSSLAKLSSELKEKLKNEFKEGLEKINNDFQNLFYKIFEGGKAALKTISVNPEYSGDEEQKELNYGTPSPVISDCDLKKEELKGIEIMISLPKKRVNSLDALSGGERSLISVALLFAITSINPPPFLMLDETDAALDETNSKKYGMLLQEISKKTQLIVITHNRETMKQAGVLLGVTLGKDGISRVLSVKLESELPKNVEV